MVFLFSFVAIKDVAARAAKRRMVFLASKYLSQLVSASRQSCCTACVELVVQQVPASCLLAGDTCEGIIPRVSSSARGLCSGFASQNCRWGPACQEPQLCCLFAKSAAPCRSRVIGEWCPADCIDKPKGG